MAKIGEGHASAMGRQGLRELRGAVYPNSNIAQQVEMGVWGTATPQEVTEARRGDDVEAELSSSQGSILSERVQQSGSRSGPSAPEPAVDLSPG